MTIEYNQYEYLFPPRPETAIPAHQIPSFEYRDYIAQVKKNGTCNVIFIHPKSNTIICKTRHFDVTTNDGVPHSRWSPTQNNMAWTRILPGNGWYVFAAELLHSKVANGPKDVNYIFDILVDDGEYLVGTTFEERQEHLRVLFEQYITNETYSHFVIDPHLWVAVPYTTNLLDAWNMVSDTGNLEDEGLVLKKRTAKLKRCCRKDSNAIWMVKSRFPTKNYSY